jgi:flavodoxin-like protein
VRVLILYESRRGFTLTVARAMRDGLREHGVDAMTAPLRSVDVGTIAASDALVVGTWVAGLILFGVGPAPGVGEAVERLPDLEGRRTIVYCTCEVAPRGTLDTLSGWLERRGADVVGRAVFRRKKSLAKVPGAIDGILEVLQPAP